LGAFGWCEIDAHAESLKVEILSGSTHEPTHPLPSQY
jgi:hypothetical protein